MSELDPDTDLGHLPKCGICGNVMVRIKQVTERKRSPIYVCNKGKETFRMPCDGYVFENALKNT